MGNIHMNKGRAGEDRGSKETDGCPLTPSSSAFALAWLFLRGIVGNSETLICSHALDLAGRK
jgi:hypothetical protein